MTSRNPTAMPMGAEDAGLLLRAGLPFEAALTVFKSEIMSASSRLQVAHASHAWDRPGLTSQDVDRLQADTVVNHEANRALANRRAASASEFLVLHGLLEERPRSGETRTFENVPSELLSDVARLLTLTGTRTESGNFGGTVHWDRMQDFPRERVSLPVPTTVGAKPGLRFL